MACSVAFHRSSVMSYTRRSTDLADPAWMPSMISVLVDPMGSRISGHDAHYPS